MSRLDTASHPPIFGPVELWSPNSKFLNLRSCKYGHVWPGFCYQNYHQTDVTSCVSPLPLWPGLQLAQLFSTHALGFHRPKQDVDMESPITLHFAFEHILTSKRVQTSEQSDTKRPKSEPKKQWQHMTTGVPRNMWYTTNIQKWCPFSQHRGFPLGSRRVLGCTVVAGSRHDTLIVTGATFNPVSRHRESESLPKLKKTGGFKMFQRYCCNMLQRYKFRFKFMYIFIIYHLETSDIFMKLMVRSFSRSILDVFPFVPTLVGPNSRSRMLLICWHSHLYGYAIQTHCHIANAFGYSDTECVHPSLHFKRAHNTFRDSLFKFQFIWMFEMDILLNYLFMGIYWK